MPRLHFVGLGRKAIKRDRSPNFCFWHKAVIQRIAELEDILANPKRVLQIIRDELSDLDVVFDTLGGASIKRSMPLLRRGGHPVTILGMPDAATFREYGKPLLAILGYLANLGLRRLARRHGVHFHYLLMRSSGEQLAKITELVDAGRLRPVIDKVFPLEQVADAFRYSEEGHATGKIVIAVR